MLGISGCWRCFGHVWKRCWVYQDAGDALDVWKRCWVYQDAGDALDMCGRDAGYIRMLEMLLTCVKEMLSISERWRCFGHV